MSPGLHNQVPVATLSAADRIALPTGVAGERFIRDFLFLAIILLSWFTLTPFPDLSDPRLLEASTKGDLLNQAATVLLTLALAAFAVAKRTTLVLRIVTLPLVLTIVVFAISALLSSYPELATRRLALAMLTLFQVGMLLLLPCGREHFARLLTVAALIILAACYFGVAFLPQLSIHQTTDIFDPSLAGNWRGFFAQKNGAGSSMVLLIFIGIFIYRAWNRLAGGVIIVFAGIFLIFTRDKSSLGFLPVVLALSYLIPRSRGALATLVLVLVPPILINLMTIGSVMFESIRTFAGEIMSDPTFTGRDEIWRFALAHIAERPLFGFGFEAFWGTPQLVDSWTYQLSWSYRASDAHNGYLNLAVTTGIVGLSFALCWIIGQTFISLRRAIALGTDRVLTSLFLQCWLFGLCLSGTESAFFRGGSEVWMFIVLAMIGLRYQTLARSFE